MRSSLRPFLSFNLALFCSQSDWLSWFRKDYLLVSKVLKLNSDQSAQLVLEQEKCKGKEIDKRQRQRMSLLFPESCLPVQDLGPDGCFEMNLLETMSDLA